MYPVLFNIDSIQIQSSTVFLFLWIIMFGIYIRGLILKEKLSIDFVNDYYYFFILSFFIFWRLGDVYLNFQNYNANLISILFFWDQNFSLYIWFIWFLFIFIFTILLKKEKVLKWFDILIKPFLLFMLFVSVSHLLSWEDYWKPSDSMFAITFNIPEVRYTIPVFPVQVYESIWILLILLMLIIISSKKRVIWIISSLWFFLFFVLELTLSFFRASQDKLILFSIFQNWIEFHIVLFLILSIIFVTTLIIRSHRQAY